MSLLESLRVEMTISLVSLLKKLESVHDHFPKLWEYKHHVPKFILLLIISNKEEIRIINQLNPH